MLAELPTRNTGFLVRATPCAQAVLCRLVPTVHTRMLKDDLLE